MSVGGLADDAMTPRRYLAAGRRRGDSEATAARQRPWGEGRWAEEKETALSAGLAPTGELVPRFMSKNAAEAGILPETIWVGLLGGSLAVVLGVVGWSAVRSDRRLVGLDRGCARLSATKMDLAELSLGWLDARIHLVVKDPF